MRDEIRLSYEMRVFLGSDLDPIIKFFILYKIYAQYKEKQNKMGNNLRTNNKNQGEEQNE